MYRQQLREQILVERTEKSLLQHRLQRFNYADGEDGTDTREELERKAS
jgi:hypothetical protein